MPLVSGLGLTTILSLGSFALVLLAAGKESRRRTAVKRNLERILAELSPAFNQDPDPVVVHDDNSGLLVCGRELRLVDLRGEGAMLQTFDLTQIAAVKLYESKRGELLFRLVTHHHAETRLIRAHGTVGAHRLFDLLATAGARMQFVPEGV